MGMARGNDRCISMQENHPAECSRYEDRTEFVSMKLRDSDALCCAQQLHVHMHLVSAAGFQIQPVQQLSSSI